MGIDNKASLLPAPTESESTNGATEFESRLTDKTSYSLPEDGSPITISTRRRRLAKDSSGINSKKSHTSLLIEYFEGGSSSPTQSRRPSVRVKVRPSSRVRRKASNDHIKISERNTTRTNSHTKRARVSSNIKTEKPSDLDVDAHSNGSYHSTTEDSNITFREGGQIEVEFTPRRHGSPLIPHNKQGPTSLLIDPSELSSVPHDSFLDGNTQCVEYKRRNLGTTTDKTGMTASITDLNSRTGVDKLQLPQRSRSRSLSRERIVVQKAVEKVRSENSIQRRRKHSSRSRSASSELGEVVKPLKKSNRSHNFVVMASGADTSLLNSHLSAKSGEAYSYRSGTSRSSINNPKLLETVEDAIRRLILPELSALKREQSKHIHRDRRSSITSASVHSKESRESGISRKRSEPTHGIDSTGQPELRKINTENFSEDTSMSHIAEKQNYQITHNSTFVRERENSTATIFQDSERLLNKNSYDKQQSLEIKAANIVADNPNILATRNPPVSSSQDTKELIQPPKENCRGDSNLYSINDNSLNTGQPIGPINSPMPLMNDNNSSEITRSSILSAKSEFLDASVPHCETSRSTSPPGPYNSNKSPVSFQRSLGTQHSNMSRGNVCLDTIDSESWQRFTEFELDEHGRKIIREVLYTGQEAYSNNPPSQYPTRYSEFMSDNNPYTYNNNQERETAHGRARYFYQDIQEVPPPLRYVPYAQQRQGLSPIQSVSGWTENESENFRESRLSRSTGSYSSIGRNAMRRQSAISNRSYESNGSHENPYDFAEVRKGGLADSEITQDSDDMDEQDMKLNRDREVEQNSFTVSSSHAEKKKSTDLKSNFTDAQNLDTSNASILKSKSESNRHAADVQSAVASIVNPSDLTGLSGIQTQFDSKGYHSSAEEELENIISARPRSGGEFNEKTKDESVIGTNRASRQNSPVMSAGEHSLGEKEIEYDWSKDQTSLTVEKDSLSKNINSMFESRQEIPTIQHKNYADDHEKTELLQHKSFKERKVEASSQCHLPQENIEENASHVEYQMGVSGIPDLKDPMPEIGYGNRDSDTLTNASGKHGSIFETQHQSREQWSVLSSHKSSHKIDATKKSRSDSSKDISEDSRIVDVSSSGGVRLNKGLDNETAEEWHRDSSERKRDTLVTNPYENNSPVAAHDELDPEIPEFHGFQRKLSYATRSLNPCRDEGCNLPLASNSHSSQINTPRTAKEHAEIISNAACDPFYTPKHQRSLSGLSHGMCSPLYDGATGNGIDRIESRDIIALMEHLTVRDAQRSARDTEILVTLVRAAAEMRNSFEDMKRLLADTEDVIITEVQANTDRSVQKVIQGPRPAPQTTRRPLRQGSYYEIYDDMPAKKTNVFRRALKGLSLKSANDLGKIEEMLVQLLGEVEGLKVAQTLKPIGNRAGLYDQSNRGGHDDYEDEGNPSVSTPGHSGFLGHGPVVDGSRSTNNMRMFDGRKYSDHRISTVPEDDERRGDSDTQTVFQNVVENMDTHATPGKEIPRQGSAPAPSSPLLSEGNFLGNQNMQASTSTVKSKKQKVGSSSSWIPKVSRWSETTASSVFRGFRSNGRNGGRKPADESSPGRWVSDNEPGNSSENEPGGNNKCSSLHSQDGIGHHEATARDMSPVLVEDVKYKAHRNSQNLQHPQPRQGPTDRYQTALESQVDNLNSTNNSEWNTVEILNHDRAQGRHSRSGDRSPISDEGYSTANQRCPKTPCQESSLGGGSERSVTRSRGKLTKPSPLSNERSPMREGEDRTRSASRNACALKCIPTRKPTGPRSMYSSPSNSSH